MSSFEEYANKYQTVRMERRDGVLQVTLHTEGQSLRWGFLPHGELPEAFHEIGADRENKVVILSNALWVAQFGADRNILNKTILLDNEQYTVIGILPAGGAFDLRGAAGGQKAAVAGVQP